MILSLGYVAVYVVLIGVSSFIERPVGRGFGAFQLNVLIRLGSLAAAIAALLAVHGTALPTGSSLLAGLGIGLITGVGSICYCLSLSPAWGRPRSLRWRQTWPSEISSA